MTRDRAETPRRCPLCNGMPEHADCRLCAGLGVIDATTAARWQHGGPVKSTSTTIVTADIVQAWLDKLRPRTDQKSRELYADGRAFLTEIVSWRLSPVERAVANEMYSRVGAWQREVGEHLTAKE